MKFQNFAFHSSKDSTLSFSFLCFRRQFSIAQNPNDKYLVRDGRKKTSRISLGSTTYVSNERLTTRDWNNPLADESRAAALPHMLD